MTIGVHPDFLYLVMSDEDTAAALSMMPRDHACFGGEVVDVV